jgi:Rrf2 family protein
MKLSTKGRYGMRAMLDLALHYGQGAILVRDIAKRQEVSERYLEHLLISLKAAGMVRSTRGTHGGFSLTMPPSKIRLDEIVQALEGSLAPVDCVDDPGVCTRSQSCVTRDVWTEMKDAMVGVLSSRTLQDLAERQTEKEATSYQI